MLINDEACKKTRQWHRKSRGGCHECKRRRKKCDETKPSCSRCVSGFLRCLYPSTSPAITTMRIGQFSTRRASIEVLKTSWTASISQDMFPILQCLDQAHSGLDNDPKIGQDKSFPSDTDLCQYYLRYLYPEPSVNQNASTSRPGVLTLPRSALQNEAVYHALLAVSAVRLACDMISGTACPEPNGVYQVLLSGYQHLNQASDRMRKALSHSDSTDLELLIASTLLLVPFAAASQQVNHWISSRATIRRYNVKLSSTPRDMITFVRGVKGMLETLPGAASVMDCNSVISIDQSSDKAAAAPIDSFESATPERSHSASKIITSSSRQALVRLGVRLNSLCSEFNDPLNHDFSACRTAFEILEQTRDSVIPILASSEPECLSFRIVIPKSTPSWLQSFIGQPCKLGSTNLLPHDPLTRLLLSFYAQVPQQYLEIVLPLLDQRLQSPLDASSDWFALNLTRTQAFALDVYAHWSVLMSLVEEKSWWIGSLPVTTLTGVVNRYGTGFTRRLWPESGDQGGWWPGEMLRMMRDAKRTG